MGHNGGQSSLQTKNIQVSTDLEQVAMFWLINKNLVELEIIEFLLPFSGNSKSLNIIVPVYFF